MRKLPGGDKPPSFELVDLVTREARALAQHEFPPYPICWSPDGGVFAYFNGPGNTLVLVDAATGKASQEGGIRWRGERPRRERPRWVHLSRGGRYAAGRPTGDATSLLIVLPPDGLSLPSPPSSP